MIILDENLDVPQRLQLDRWGIHFRRIGGEIGRFGMDDYDEITHSSYAVSCDIAPFAPKLNEWGK